MSDRIKIANLRFEDRLRLVGFTRLLASYGCAGEPACEPVTADAATGKKEGGLCGPCEAQAWLSEHDLLNR